MLGFINAVLDGSPKLQELTLLNPYQPGDYLESDTRVLKITAKDEAERYYDIEIQIIDQAFYSKRALYHWSKLYAEQLKKDDQHETLNKTISIHVLNFDFLANEENYHNIFHILNTQSHNRALEDFEMHFIELQKFKESPEKTQILSALDRWVTFLSSRSKYDKEHIPAALQSDTNIVQAIDILDTMHMSERERVLYEGQEKCLRDEAAGIQTAYDRARKKERTIGRKEGKIEEKVNIAQNLLAAGQSAEFASKITGLSLDEMTERVT